MHATTACILMCYDVKWQNGERWKWREMEMETVVKKVIIIFLKLLHICRRVS